MGGGDSSNYRVGVYQSNKKPDGFAAVLVDINTETGEPGTYTTDHMTIEATDNEGHHVKQTIPVDRVSTGLNIAANAINCYRVLRPESAGKQINELTAADLAISYTATHSVLLIVDKSDYTFRQVPVLPKIEFLPPEGASGEELEYAQDRLAALGLSHEFTGEKDGIVSIRISCKKRLAGTACATVHDHESRSCIR